MSFYIINLLALSIIIAVHEYGHFYYAKKYGHTPSTFAIGFGPELFGFNHDGTRFALKLIPFGGYVAVNPEDMNDLTAWQRVKVVLGGPLANLILCMIIGFIYALYGTLPPDFVDTSTLKLIALGTIGSALLFIAAIPLTAYALVQIFLNPVEMYGTGAGPIGVVSGQALPAESFAGVTLLDQFLILTWAFSLMIGTVNLMPLSILDGGHIFREAFAKFPKFLKGWNVATGVALAVLIIYLISGDVYNLIF